MSILYTPIMTITGISSTLEAIIVNRIGDTSRFPYSAELDPPPASIRLCASTGSTTESETE